MEFWLKGTSWVCRGRHGEVGIVEFGLDSVRFYLNSLLSLFTTAMTDVIMNDVIITDVTNKFV